MFYSHSVVLWLLREVFFNVPVAWGRARVRRLIVKATDQITGLEVNFTVHVGDAASTARALHQLCRQSSNEDGFWGCMEQTAERFARLGLPHLEVRRLPMHHDMFAEAKIGRGWDRYLTLLGSSLTGGLYPKVLDDAVATALHQGEYGVLRRTMLSLSSLRSLQRMLDRADRDGVPGDVFEAGVWRGGAVIWLRAVIEAQDTDPSTQHRRVWAADSFKGLPMRSYIPAGFPGDEADSWFLKDAFHASEESVRSYLSLYGLLDNGVVFVRGFFNESLRSLSVGATMGEAGDGSSHLLGDIALLRIDCDMYESYMDVLYNLAGRVAPGGFIVADDYSLLPDVRLAVDEFRAAHGISAPLRWATREQRPTDPVYWRVGDDRIQPRLDLYQQMMSSRRQVTARHLVDLDDGSTVHFEQALGESYLDAVANACHAAHDVDMCRDRVQSQAEQLGERVQNVPKSLGETVFHQLGI